MGIRVLFSTFIYFFFNDAFVAKYHFRGVILYFYQTMLTSRLRKCPEADELEIIFVLSLIALYNFRWDFKEIRRMDASQFIKKFWANNVADYIICSCHYELGPEFSAAHYIGF